LSIFAQAEAFRNCPLTDDPKYSFTEAGFLSPGQRYTPSRNGLDESNDDMSGIENPQRKPSDGYANPLDTDGNVENEEGVNIAG
jgi:hypothetical protein